MIKRFFSTESLKNQVFEIASIRDNFTTDVQRTHISNTTHNQMTETPTEYSASLDIQAALLTRSGGYAPDVYISMFYFFASTRFISPGISTSGF